MAAPKGNKNAVGNQGPWGDRVFFDQLRRAIVQDDYKRLRQAAEALLNKAADGEPWAIKELADRTDGKAKQVVAGDADNPLSMLHKIERVIIDNAKD